MDGEAPTSLGGITKVVLRVFTIDPVIDTPIERVVTTLIALMDLGVLEVTLIVALPIAPFIPQKEKL